MEEKEIYAGNKLIAEFDGWEPFFGYHPRHEAIAWRRKDDVDIVYGSEPWEADIIPYNLSWGWLMPVVEKIEQMVDNDKGDINAVILYRGICTMRILRNKLCVKQIEIKANIGRIKATWLAVVEFIKWYNQQTK